MVRVGVLGIGVAAGAVGAGCFYTTPINQRPRAEIEVDTPGPVYKDVPVTVSARKSFDAEDASPRYRWQALTCPTEASCTSFDSSTLREFTFAPPSKDPVRIQLTVTDDRGATELALLTLTPVNRPPVVDAQAQGWQTPLGGYTLGRTITVVAAATDADEDEVAYAFAYFPPPASVTANVGWEQVNATTVRITPDVTGEWSVRATADDGDQGIDEATVLFTVWDDAAPCIGATEPPATTSGRYILARSDPPRRFAVHSVSDDLDPYPVPAGDPDALLRAPAFTWFRGEAAQGLVEVDGHDLPDLFVDPLAYAPGTIVDVRVEVADRVPRTLPCLDSEPRCPVAGACAQRVSWQVEIR